MTQEQLDKLNKIVDARINERVEKILNEKIYDLLHPAVEIVSLDNPIPTYATPGDAGADIRASVMRVQTQFMDKAYIVTDKDELYDQLNLAFDKDDRIAMEELYKQIDALKEETPVAIVIKPGGHCLIPTGLFTSFPDIYVADIVPRSGIALKKRITVTNSPGKVDARYRNEWGIIVDNEGSEDFVIRQGDKIAQVQFSLKCQAQFIVKQSVDELSGEDRGGGFGHTGV